MWNYLAQFLLNDKTLLASPAPVSPPLPSSETPLPRIGLALGGGAARGWSHIGVLKTLVQNGIEPSVIAGTSIGAVVGGCYAASKLEALEDFARSLTKRRVMGLLDFHLNGAGLISGNRLRRLLVHNLANTHIEALSTRFAAIATEYSTGHEIWLTQGLLVDALCASYALPGVFHPVKTHGRWLMDGALVNPVPVTVARALGAEVVICVNLNGEGRLRGTIIPTSVPSTSATKKDASVESEAATGTTEPRVKNFLSPFKQVASRFMNPIPSGGPRLASVMIDAFNIIQDRISRSRLAGDPPDISITPRLAKIGLFEFHRAEEAILLGQQATERALPDILDMMKETKSR